MQRRCVCCVNMMACCSSRLNVNMHLFISLAQKNSLLKGLFEGVTQYYNALLLKNNFAQHLWQQ